MAGERLAQLYFTAGELELLRVCVERQLQPEQVADQVDLEAADLWPLHTALAEARTSVS